MLLYERLGISSNLIDVEGTKECLELYLKGTKDPNMDYVYKRTVVTESGFLCLYYYCLEDWLNVRKYAQVMFDGLKDYFFGEWKDITPTDDGIIDRNWWKITGWITEFREGLLWASCLNKWDTVFEIAQYPDDQCRRNTLYSKEFHQWYRLLAALLRGESINKLTRYTEFIENSRKRKEKYLLSLLRAVLDKDSDRFNKILREYMKYYKKREFVKPEITEKLAIDATILFNLARHKGLNVEIPGKYEDNLVVVDSRKQSLVSQNI